MPTFHSFAASLTASSASFPLPDHYRCAASIRRYSCSRDGSCVQ